MNSVQHSKNWNAGSGYRRQFPPMLYAISRWRLCLNRWGSLANEQLKYLTSERYQLKVEGIGDLSVVDRWNANEERPVETLSGGESFLTSPRFGTRTFGTQ